MLRKKTSPKAVLYNRSVVLLQNPYFNLFTRFLPLQDLRSLALTSRHSYNAFINRLCNPDFLFSLLNHLNHRQVEDFQRHLNRSIYDKLKLITDNDVKQEHHTAYVCWALLCGNMMLVNEARLSLAWSKATEGKSVADHIGKSINFILHFHYLRNLYNSAVADNTSFDLFFKTTKLPHPARVVLQKKVVELLLSMSTNTFYYNSNHADFCFLGSTSLIYVDLTGINLSGAIITHVSFAYTNLSNANFSCVTFNGTCSLQSATTNNANFRNANLARVAFNSNNFSTTDLTNVNVCYTHFDIYYANYNPNGYDQYTQFVGTLNNLSSKLAMFMTMNFSSRDGLNNFKVLIANELKSIFKKMPLVSEEDIHLLTDISEHEFFRLPRKISFFTKKVLAAERSPSQLILDETLSTLLNREQSDNNDWEDLGKNTDHEHASNISPRK